MPFPLPLDPEFRKEVACSWIIDVYDRIDMEDYGKAEESLKIAEGILLSLPPGTGSPALEDFLTDARVKLEQSTN